jgi:hypothetical protein
MLLRLRLYIAANYEARLEADIRYSHAVWGSVVIKKFYRAWYNPMKYLLGDVGKKVVPVNEFYSKENCQTKPPLKDKHSVR